MNETLFENPGAKIKKVATILFWIDTIAFIILAFVFGWREEYWRYEKVFHPMHFFCCLLLGPAVSYVWAILMFAFGELVENSCKIRDIITIPVRPKKSEESKRETVPSPNTYNSNTYNSKTWKCTCGKVNEDFVFTCVCGRNKRDVLSEKQESSI